MGRRAHRVPKLIYTDERCILRGFPEPRLPVLVGSDNQVVGPVTDWFRNMRIENEPVTSVQTRAEHIRQFWEFMTDKGRDWREVDDAFLSLYCNMQRLGQRVSREQRPIGSSRQNVKPIDTDTIDYRTISIFKFYKWCLQKGVVDKHTIGETDWNGDEPIEPRITVKVKTTRSKTGGARVTWSSPLLYNNKNKQFQHIPTEEEVGKIHATLSDKHLPDVAWRNILMSTVQEQTGLRREELQRMTVNQIPDADTVDDMVEEGTELFPVEVKGKGSKVRTASFTPVLLRDIRDYIDEARADLVKRMKVPNKRRKTFKTYREPKNIFLSHTRGAALSKGAIGDALSAGFREAGVAGRPHRSRAKFLNDMVRLKAFKLWDIHGMKGTKDQDILDEVAEMAGHGHVGSLRPYIRFAKKEYTKMSKAERTIVLEQMNKSAERSLSASMAKLKENRELVQVAKALKIGDTKSAVSQLEELLKELKGDGR